eukprot:725824-Pyramimonas_sp.AAC.1
MARKAKQAAVKKAKDDEAARILERQGREKEEEMRKKEEMEELINRLYFEEEEKRHRQKEKDKAEKNARMVEEMKQPKIKSLNPIVIAFGRLFGTGGPVKRSHIIDSILTTVRYVTYSYSSGQRVPEDAVVTLVIPTTSSRRCCCYSCDSILTTVRYVTYSLQGNEFQKMLKAQRRIVELEEEERNRKIQLAKYEEDDQREKEAERRRKQKVLEFKQEVQDLAAFKRQEYERQKARE